VVKPIVSQVLRRAPICKQANQSGQMNWSTKPCQSVRESGLSVSQLMESGMSLVGGGSNYLGDYHPTAEHYVKYAVIIRFIYYEVMYL